MMFVMFFPCVLSCECFLPRRALEPDFVSSACFLCHALLCRIQAPICESTLLMATFCLLQGLFFVVFGGGVVLKYNFRTILIAFRSLIDVIPISWVELMLLMFYKFLLYDLCCSLSLCLATIAFIFPLPDSDDPTLCFHTSASVENPSELVDF